jgi:hypothetical protein
MKSIHKALLASLLLNCATLLVSQTALATDVTVEQAPPADRHEVVPRPRPGYVWAAGHWEWTGRFYSWTSGTWIVQHRNQNWVADSWEQVGSQWHFTAGHWINKTAADSGSLQAQDRR